MKISEFFDRTRKETEETILFDYYFDDFRKRVKNPQNPNWIEEELDREYAEDIYGLSGKILTGLASRHCEHQSIYDEATEIMQALRETIKETLGLELPEVKIKSLAEMMAERGLVEIVKNEEGEKFLKPTEKSERIVKAMKAHDN